jgi:micrococcal nuclease
MSKRIRRSIKKNPVVMLVVAIIGTVMFLVSQNGQAPVSKGQANGAQALSGSYDAVLVERVVDGDTLKLANGERVRLIGIDTPEVHESEKLYRDSRKSGQDIKIIQALGRRAAQFTKSLVEGKTVRLEFDVEKRDKYKRLLAYVYLPDGTFVNAQIIKEGYASLMTYPPNVKYVETFTQLYREARENRRGLWNE